MLIILPLKHVTPDNQAFFFVFSKSPIFQEVSGAIEIKRLSGKELQGVENFNMGNWKIL